MSTLSRSTSSSASQSRQSPHLDPLAFPSDTDLRFVLLIVTVLGASLFIYNWICLQTHTQELIASARCALRYQVKPGQAISALQAAVNAMRQCEIPYQRIETAYMISGVVLVIAVAILIYWLYPFWKLWHEKLVPLRAETWPELMPYLAECCRKAQLARPPSFVYNPSDQIATGLAFGRVGRYYVALSIGLVSLFSRDRARFQAIILHELAHLRNTDVNKTYFAIASWWAFVIVALVPFAVISAMGFAKDPDVLLNIDKVWRVLVMAVLVFLVLAATLRAREFYADVRSARWQNSADPLLRVLTKPRQDPGNAGMQYSRQHNEPSQLSDEAAQAETTSRPERSFCQPSCTQLLPKLWRGLVLTMLEVPRQRWQRVRQFHPDPGERIQTLNETDRLFRMGLWDALGLGIAIGIAAPNVRELVSSFLYLLPQIVTWEIPFWEAFGMALILAPLIAVTVGLSAWRATFAALVRGQVPLGIGHAGLCVGVGLFLGTLLPLSIETTPLSLVYYQGMLKDSLSLVVFSLPWGFVVLVSLFLFLRWIATGTSAWLNVMISSRSPRLFYIVGLVMASGVLVIVLAQVFYFRLVALTIAGPLKTPSDLLIGFTILTFLSIAPLISNNPLSLGVLVAFVCLWALPLAAWFWRKQMTTPVELNWAFLDASSQPVVLPRQDPFRLRFALSVALGGGLALLLIRIGVHVSLSEAIRSSDQLRLAYGNIVLAALLQATAAGIVAGWVRRLGVLHGLFTAFVGGCVMTVVILSTSFLFGGTASADLIWETFRYVITGGALLALPITLIVSVIIHRTRKPNHEVVGK